MERVLVVGSAVVDLFVELDEVPNFARIIQASSIALYPGGKALNQAVCLSRLGTKHVSLLTTLGNDALGDFLINTLNSEGVDTNFCLRTSEKLSDITILLNSSHHETGIIGGRSAIKELKVADILNLKSEISQFDGILVTFETPLEVVEVLLKITGEVDVPVFLNPAPVRTFQRDLVSGVKCLIPNKIEAQKIADNLGIEYNNIDEIIMKLISDYRVETVCITDGGHGCIYNDGQLIRRADAQNVNVVDTTGASDAFCAALTLSLLRGKSLEHSVTFANLAGGIACETKGGLPSMPTSAKMNSRLSIPEF